VNRIPSFTRRLLRWESFLAVLILVVVVWAAFDVTGFWDPFTLASAAGDASERALLMLPLVLIIVAREIDISIASVLGLASVVFGLLIQAGAPLAIAILLPLIVGAAAGSINGFLVARVGMSSLIVTLGTLAFFRGLAYILLRSDSVFKFPSVVTTFGSDSVAGTFVPWTLVPFILLAPIFGIVLHRTATGRRIFAVGGGPDTALYAGVSVRRLRFMLFLTSGIIAAAAGLVYTARLSNARADNGLGMELDVITIVLLGGISIFGGKGSLVGAVLSLVLISVTRTVLTLDQFSGFEAGTVIGSILILSLLAGNLAARLREGSRGRQMNRLLLSKSQVLK
jgi:rhamnose transport system permease protein